MISKSSIVFVSFMEQHVFLGETGSHISSILFIIALKALQSIAIARSW